MWKHKSCVEATTSENDRSEEAIMKRKFLRFLFNDCKDAAFLFFCRVTATRFLESLLVKRAVELNA